MRDIMTIKQRRAAAIVRLVELRLEEARTLVQMMDSNFARKEMNRIARSYEHLAAHYLGRYSNGQQL
jgi:hypothetical protein